MRRYFGTYAGYFSYIGWASSPIKITGIILLQSDLVCFHIIFAININFKIKCRCRTPFSRFIFPVFRGGYRIPSIYSSRYCVLICSDFNIGYGFRNRAGIILNDYNSCVNPIYIYVITLEAIIYIG
jgi:hypothetical protein